ncbi:hypothetical protein CHLNCDRAFT_145117 [Chlorella variabilis]|uniref:ShKT domain-containing protein n=1 Tax=Chlorella variabilis TaxID=554065 RepID=E1ZCL9_CHLVA|nr:hypothetical protein CHLNCDRAFT_145117 [Chlorella variabilis]EFN56264.1 hypothetical protein CHLNCDRAFT_145117 [Chlorella variabilis]|eukprot:XP_005848366.1 hypothetical protein CHLNCDRAFT_145117 [Chlorella variabilis]
MKNAVALLLLLALLSSAHAVLEEDRTDIFPGYKEEGAPHACNDELPEVVCKDYKEANMCETSYVKKACQLTCGACTRQHDRPPEPMWAR